MRKLQNIIIFIVLITCNIACKNTNRSFTSMPPELDSVIAKYIANHPDNEIYDLIFESRNGKQFFTLQCSSDLYNSDYVDGCFMREGKIIVYWSVNKSWKDSLLHIRKEEQCLDSLAKYTDFAKNDVINDASYNPLTYRILSINQYREVVASDWEYPKPACDSNVIKSSALNTIINNYINTNGSPTIVYLRFNKVNGDTFVAVGKDCVYDQESFSGMFYRDDRVVVVYSVDNVDNMDIIDKQSMLPIQEMCDYKTRKSKTSFSLEEKYRIVSKEVIDSISDMNLWWKI